MGVENIKVEPMDVYIGTDAAQVQTVTAVADVSSSLNSHYFILYPQGMATRYAVWIDINNTGTAPSLGADYTTVSVEVAAANASAATVATAIQVAVDALTPFVATVSGKVVTITNSTNGFAPFAHDAQDSTKQTGFAFSVSTVGDTFAKVGLLDGDIEVSGLARNPVDIMAHQYGASVLGQIFTGSPNPEMTFNLKEVSLTNYEKIQRYAGGTFYPVATSSTALIGGGTAGLFGSPKFVQVVLHPIRLNIADKTNDYYFPKATLDLDSITFSGENLMVVPVNMKAFLDDTKQGAVNVWAYGDWSQSSAVSV